MSGGGQARSAQDYGLEYFAGGSWTSLFTNLNTSAPNNINAGNTTTWVNLDLTSYAGGALSGVTGLRFTFRDINGLQSMYREVDVFATGAYWAPSAGGGGTGTWSTGVNNWAVTEGTQGSGPQSSTTTLFFGNTAGTVTVSNGVNVAAGMTFSTDGYTVTNSTITMTGADAASNTITTAASVGATISSQLAGSGGMTKAGAGTLTFGGSAANTLTGTTTVSAGTLRLNKSAANAQLFTDGNMQTFVRAESSGSMPTGWAVSGGQVTGSQSPSNSPFVNIYGNNASSFRLNDAGSTAGTAGFLQAFSTTTNYQSISVNFDFMVPTLALTNLVGGAWGIQFDGGGANANPSSSVHYRIDRDGYFSIANNAGTNNILSLTAGSWYNVQATFDLTATNTGTGNGAGFQSGSITQFGGATASWNNVALLDTSLGFSRLLVRDRSSFESGDLLLDNVSVVANADAIAGNLAVAAGATLLLSQSHQVNNNAAVTLSGGTMQRAGGVSEVFGSLDLTTGSFLDFGTGAVGNLTFGTYQNNQQTESALLTLNNFMPGNSFTFSSTSFSTNSFGSYFTFGTGYVDSSITNTGSTFTITAIPEPSTILAALGLAGLMLWPAAKRLRCPATSTREE